MALDEAFETTWFSTLEEANSRKVESRTILAWLREIDETLSPPSPPAPLPGGSDDKAWFVQRVNWHAHGWLVGYLPHLVEVRARLRFPYNPLEVLPDDQRDRVVEQISFDLLSGIEKGFKHEANKAVVYETKPAPRQQRRQMAIKKRSLVALLPKRLNSRSNWRESVSTRSGQRQRRMRGARGSAARESRFPRMP